MRNLKILGGLVAGVGVLVCAVLIGVGLLVNPNHYKGNIAAAVKESTGRELHLNGDIKLSVFPWIALELGPATLSNPPGFSEEPFLSFTRASVRVKLLPLLRERLEVARVEIDGLNVRLSKNAQGKGNWQEAERNPDAAPRADARHDAWASFGEVRIHKGRLSYERFIAENINLETGAVTAEHPVPVSVTFDGNRGIPGEQISMNAKFDLSAQAAGEPAPREPASSGPAPSEPAPREPASSEPAPSEPAPSEPAPSEPAPSEPAPREPAPSEQLLFAAVTLSGTLTRPGAVRPVHWDLSAPDLKVNLTQQTVALPAFTMNFASAHVNGAVSATKILDNLSMTGGATLAPLALREFAAQLGIVLLKTRDAKALSALSATTDFAYGSQALSLSKLQMRLDDTELAGQIQLRTAEARAMEFNLTADQIDLDRYRAPEGATAENESKLSAADEAVKRPTPLDTLGTFSLKAVHFAHMDLSGLRVNLAAKDNVIHLFPIEAQIDGGRYSGDITFDRRSVVPALSVDEHLAGVDMARLLANSAQKGRLSGRATLNLKATARGVTLDELLKTLSGHLEANLADGALEGIDVGYELGVAQALIDRSSAPPRDNTGHTRFEAFKTSAQITNGVAETRDLTIASQALKVSGQGSANLSSKAIDFRLLAAIVTAPQRTTEIPLKVTGTYSAPTVRPDIEAVAKDQLKQKLQDVLKKNGLQGLFSK